MIHADIDPAEIGKNRKVDVPIVGDCKKIVRALIDALRLETDAAQDREGWRASLDEVRHTYPVSYDRPADGALSPQLVIEAVGKAAGPDAIYVSGVGQHQM